MNRERGSIYLLNFWYYYPFLFDADTLLVTNCKHDVFKNLTLASNFLLDSFGPRQCDTVNMISLHRVYANRLRVANDFARGTTGNAGTFTTGSTEEPIGYGLSKKSIYILFLLLMHKLLHQISDV